MSTPTALYRLLGHAGRHALPRRARVAPSVLVTRAVPVAAAAGGAAVAWHVLSPWGGASCWPAVLAVGALCGCGARATAVPVVDIARDSRQQRRAGR